MINKTEKEIMKNWRQANNPVVSVCCTTFNHENFIAEAINSFLNQETDFPFEIIIRDDCSLDKTASIIKSYVSKFPNIINPIYEEENTFSKGVRPMPAVYKNAAGKYFALCDGDDYWTDPLKLQKQVTFLEKNNKYVITYSSVEAFDENGKIENYIGGATRDLESLDLQKGTSLNTLTVCFRNVLKELPPEFQFSKLGDIFTWSLLGAYGKGKFIEDIKPAIYRKHNGGIYSKKSMEHRLRMTYLTVLALYSYYLRIGNKPLTDYYHKRSVKLSILLYGNHYNIKVVLGNIIYSVLTNIFPRLFKHL